MDMTCMQKRRCCFIGQRPERLASSEEAIKTWLDMQIDHAIRLRNITTFITGMNIGVDLWAAELVIRKRLSCQVHLIAAVPWTGFTRTWNMYWKNIYKNIFNSADHVHIVSEHYYPGIFEDRNKWMLQHSEYMIGYYNGDSETVQNMIQYAGALHIPFNVFNESMGGI